MSHARPSPFEAGQTFNIFQAAVPACGMQVSYWFHSLLCQPQQPILFRYVHVTGAIASEEDKQVAAGEAEA